MNIRTDMRLDKAQFFAWIEGEARKYELADGRVVLQPYVTRGHATICTNIVVALASRLDQSRFAVSQGDFAVGTGERSVRYADVLVEPRSTDLEACSTEAALVLVEVLSPSTMHVDFHEKLEEYSALPTLGTYLICAQDEPRVWVWTRADGQWPQAPQILDDVAAEVDLPVLGITLPLAEIYRHVGAR